MANDWSEKVKESSDAKKIPEGLFNQSAQEIAQTLHDIVMDNPEKEHKHESAMDMLNFYINRAGSNLSESDRGRLEQAKVELRALFGR